MVPYILSMKDLEILSDILKDFESFHVLQLTASWFLRHVFAPRKRQEVLGPGS